MPELPEIELYLHALTPRILHEPVKGVRVRSPSLFRTFDPPVSAMVGLRVLGLERLGKRVVWVLEEGLFAVFHLMISGRFKWRASGAAVPKMGAHGKFGEPCPICLTPIQRIVYANRETNYCPACQTGGKLLEDLEELRTSRRED